MEVFYDGSVAGVGFSNVGWPCSPIAVSASSYCNYYYYYDYDYYYYYL
jgi:hypothetical protein